VITSVKPNPYSESKDYAVTITGTGFNVLTLDWVNFGMPNLWNNNDPAFSTVSSTTITLLPILPNAGSHTRLLPGGISILCLAGLSNAMPFSYKE
jgi:hypothetical protein